MNLEDSWAAAHAAEQPLEEPIDGEPARPSTPADSGILEDDSVFDSEKIKVMITSDPPGTDKAVEPPGPQERSAETEAEIDSLFDGIHVGGEDD